MKIRAEVLEAARQNAQDEHGIIRVPLLYKENQSPIDEYIDRQKRNQAAFEACFLAGYIYGAKEKRK